MKLRKFFFTLLLGAILSASADEAALLQQLPATATLVATGDLAALLRQKDMAQLLKTNQELQALEKSGQFQISGLEALAVAELNLTGPLALISFKKAPQLEILTQLNRPDLKLKVQQTTSNGQKMAVLTGEKISEPLVIVRRNATTWLICPQKQLTKISVRLRHITTAYQFPAKLQGVVKVVYKPEKNAPAQLERLVASLKLTGPQQHDLQFNFWLKLTTPALAQQLKVQIPAFYALFVNMIAADRPDLADQFIQALQVRGKPQSSQLRIQFLLPEKLLIPAVELLQKFLQNTAANQYKRAPRPNRRVQ